MAVRASRKTAASPRPCDLTVSEIARRFRAGGLTPSALMESLLEQTRRLEPEVKAWVTLDEEAAMRAARQATEEIEHGGPRSPLHGIPIGVKDIFYTAGIRTTMGSPIYADFVPEYDAAAVARLKRAGAITMGKTVTTEFATLQPPPTRNPWDLAHTPGGSSSGSAAGVAARMFPAALGTQTGGSVIRPAAFNGIVGLKPTHGLISAFGVFPVSQSLDTMGVMARAVEDVALMLQEMAGHDPYDPESVDARPPDYRQQMFSLARPPRLGLLRQFFIERADPEVARHVESVAQACGRAGAVVEDARLPPSFEAALAAQSVLQNAESAVAHRHTYPKYRDRYGPKVQAQLDAGLKVSGAEYVMAKQLQPRFSREVEAALAPFDAFLAPSVNVPAPRDHGTTGDPLYQKAWTYSGVPEITLPSGLSAEGMPLAVQVIGRRLDEGRLLAVALWCEGVLSFKAAPTLAAC